LNSSENGFLKSIPVVGVVGATPVDVDLNLQTKQMRDKEIVRFREKLESGNVHSFDLRDGLVYRKNGDDSY